jgi:hypothetical protein
MYDDVRVMFSDVFKAFVRLNAILGPGAILPGIQCGLFTRTSKPERRLLTSRASSRRAFAHDSCCLYRLPPLDEFWK